MPGARATAVALPGSPENVCQRWDPLLALSRQDWYNARIRLPDNNLTALAQRRDDWCEIILDVPASNTSNGGGWRVVGNQRGASTIALGQR